MRRSDLTEFARLYDEHVRRVYGFFGYRVDARADAEDLTQQTFERALSAWDRFDDRKASAATWLMTIARNLLVDHYRKAKPDRVRPLDREAELRLDGSAGEGHDLGVSAELADALGVLGDRDREIIALRYGGDLTAAQTAELTGLSVANVDQITSRSLRRLRSELESAASIAPASSAAS